MCIRDRKDGSSSVPLVRIDVLLLYKLKQSNCSRESFSFVVGRELEPYFERISVRKCLPHIDFPHDFHAKYFLIE